MHKRLILTLHRTGVTTLLSECDLPVKEQIGLLVEDVTLLHKLVGLIVEHVPFASGALGVGDVMPRGERANVDS